MHAALAVWLGCRVAEQEFDGKSPHNFLQSGIARLIKLTGAFTAASEALANEGIAI